MAIQPEWLHKDFIEESLRKGTNNENLTITNFTIEMATAPGDNFISQMFRVRIETKTGEKLVFLIKSLPLGNMENVVHEQNFFLKEAISLSQTLPKAQKFLDKAGYTHKLYANVLYWQGPPKNLIFLEDLKLLGYVNANRQIGLDFDHSKVLLESLAILHAGSVPLVKKEPEIVKDYDFGFWNEPNIKILTRLTKKGVVWLAKEVETWTDVPREYVEKLKQQENLVLPKMFDSVRRNDEEFNVILHGDPWTSNFMFKYDEHNKIESLKFIDFQISMYNAPVLDLIYFIFSSPIEEIRLSRLDDFLEIYYNKFIEVSNKLNIDNHYSFDDLKKDFKKRLYFGFICTYCVFAITTAPPSHGVDFDQYVNTEKEFSTPQFGAERFKKGLKLALPYFVENGVL